MIRALFFSEDEKLRTDLEVMDIAFLLQEGTGMLWVDFQADPSEKDREILSTTFGFHPLAVDDALEEVHIPKVDDWGKYLYVVLHAVAYQDEDGPEVATRELDVFLGSNYLVTHHDDPIEAIDRIWGSVQRDPRYLRYGPDYMLYRLVDEMVASYMPVVEALDQAIDQLENQLFKSPRPEIVERIFAIKRSVLLLRRIIAPEREVLNKLARDDYLVVDSQAQVYFRDVYDHMVRLYSIAENIRDLVSDAMDTYLSIVNNRMNEVMKTLTIITTLFMPLSFVVGFFGMNFFIPTLPITRWMDRPVFILVLALIFLTPFAMYQWMRRRGWM